MENTENQLTFLSTENWSIHMIYKCTVFIAVCPIISQTQFYWSWTELPALGRLDWMIAGVAKNDVRVELLLEIPSRIAQLGCTLHDQ